MGDAFQTLYTGKGPKLHAAMKRIQQEGTGAIIYINKNRDHGGISEELRTIERSRSSAETSPRPMDTKDYGIGAQIIRQLGIRKLNVLTDTDRPLGNIGYGLEIARLSKLK
jgi:3,4-dihydroxy 2-butanone 4-phosphate synthase/GTP cyclohydrolase II